MGNSNAYIQMMKDQKKSESNKPSGFISWFIHTFRSKKFIGYQAEPCETEMLIPPPTYTDWPKLVDECKSELEIFEILVRRYPRDQAFIQHVITKIQELSRNVT